MKAFLDQIPPALRQTITAFTTDMWDGYLESAAEFVEEKADVTAEIVVDRFHVACNYRDSFDTLRKQECKRLKKELDESDYKEISHGMLWILRKDHDSLSPAERLRLRQLFQLTPCLHQAYTFRQELTAIFNRVDSRPQAEKALQAWCQKVHASSVTCFDRFIKTLNRYWTYILNYFNQRVSSGFAEGLNNKLKTIKRRCYGISSTTTIFQRIWLDTFGRRDFFLSTP